MACACSRAALDASLRQRVLAAGAPARFVDLPPVPLYDGGSAFLWGSTGHGKSRRATQALKAWLRTNHGGRFVSTGGLFSAIRESFEYRTPNPLYDILEAPYLVLDDIDSVAPSSEWKMDALWELLDRRYKDDLPTVFTAERDPECRVRVNGTDLAQWFDRCPGGHGYAIVRRILDICRDRIMTGPFSIDGSRKESS